MKSSAPSAPSSPRASYESTVTDVQSPVASANTSTAGGTPFLSPGSQQYNQQFEQMTHCWSFYQSPPKSPLVAIRTPQQFLSEAAHLGHIEANKLLSHQALTQAPVSLQSYLRSIEHARRALAGVRAMERTNQLAASVGTDQHALLQSHYCKLMNATAFQSSGPASPLSKQWVLSSSQIEALSNKIQQTLVDVSSGALAWNPKIAADVESLANVLMKSGRNEEAANLYQRVLDAVPIQPPVWLTSSK